MGPYLKSARYRRTEDMLFDLVVKNSRILIRKIESELFVTLNKVTLNKIIG